MICIGHVCVFLFVSIIAFVFIIYVFTCNYTSVHCLGEFRCYLRYSILFVPVLVEVPWISVVDSCCSMFLLILKKDQEIVWDPLWWTIPKWFDSPSCPRVQFDFVVFLWYFERTFYPQWSRSLWLLVILNRVSLPSWSLQKQKMVLGCASRSVQIMSSNIQRVSAFGMFPSELPCGSKQRKNQRETNSIVGGRAGWRLNQHHIHWRCPKSTKRLWGFNHAPHDCCRFASSLPCRWSCK